MKTAHRLEIIQHHTNTMKSRRRKKWNKNMISVETNYLDLKRGKRCTEVIPDKKTSPFPVDDEEMKLREKVQFTSTHSLRLLDLLIHLYIINSPWWFHVNKFDPTSIKNLTHHIFWSRNLSDGPKNRISKRVQILRASENKEIKTAIMSFCI